MEKKVPEIYLYGMTVLSNIHLLEGMYPNSDTYGEIKQSHVVVGGETGNSAIILANLGCKVSIDGPFLGVKTKDAVVGFLGRFGIDCSKLHYDQSFEGVQDLVLIDKKSRTVFGKFANYFDCGVKRWNKPSRDAIKSASIVGLDPFFGEESEMVAQLCAEEGKRYVTIDCQPDSSIHKHAAATIISNEFIKNNFPRRSIRALFKKYTKASQGLVIFTFGSSEILYGRNNSEINTLKPYKVEVKSTLGAGDTFRAGIIYGILNNLPDEDIVKFAAATAASVCCADFPMAFNPPGLNEIKSLIERDEGI
ncbi:MAG TPA: PfkB family carbohydrate kinase [Clostridia bacterium]|nr:PfkB family carbohydrate kinase [Clostridia bacterium]